MTDSTRPANEAVTDARTVLALDLLAERRPRVLTLDVFDTLVWRTVREPVDAFFLLGCRLRDDGLLRRGVDPATFAQLRCTAEKNARDLMDERGAVVPEVSLEEIWTLLAGSVTTAALDELVAAEVELERRVTVPDLAIVQLACIAKETYGAAVAAVSDTYLSEAQLARLLDRPPFDALDLRLFTSSTRGTNKGDRIWEVVLDELGVQGDDVVHIGDHPVSDVSMPREYGIATVAFHKFPPDTAHVVDREIGVREGHIFRKRPTIDPVAGDLGLTAVRAKAGWQYGALEMDESLVPYWRFGATVLGPVFAGFAEWIVRRTTEEGARRVYCFMREGELLARLVGDAASYLGADVEAVPLWVSRRVVSEAAVCEVDERTLGDFLNRRHPPTLERYLDSLGLTMADVHDLGHPPDALLDDPDVAEAVTDAILGNAALGLRIEAHARELRRRLVGYVRSVIDDEDGPLMVVDLGWGATIQQRLEQALHAEGIDRKTHGLYLVTGPTAADRMLEGLVVDGYLATAGALETVTRWVIRSPEIIEQVCMSDGGSLVGIDEHGRTVHAPQQEPPEQGRQRRAVQEGMVAFQREWQRYRPYLDGFDLSSDVAADAGRGILMRFLL